MSVGGKKKCEAVVSRAVVNVRCLKSHPQSAWKPAEKSCTTYFCYVALLSVPSYAPQY